MADCRCERETTPSDATPAPPRRPKRAASTRPTVSPPTRRLQDAEQAPRDPDAAAHYEEMAERGAHQQGEGRVP